MSETNVAPLLVAPNAKQDRVPRGPFRVDQIKRGELDARDTEVDCIYALRSGDYAIYSVKDIGWAGGIAVQYSDDPAREKEQRERVLSIGEARAELASLLMGWKPERRKVYDCKIAMALQLALDSQTTAAQKIIDGARADVHNERAAAGRLQYLASAVVACAALALLLLGVRSIFLLLQMPAHNLWLAGQAGLAGAAFSIVLAIKKRTVALDTNLPGNASDGLLRLAIGMISGGFLLLLLESKFLPQFAFGDVPIALNAMVWQGIVVLGFVAGFAERLVPDLLNKAQEQAVGAPAQSAA